MSKRRGCQRNVVAGKRTVGCVWTVCILRSRACFGFRISGFAFHSPAGPPDPLPLSVSSVTSVAQAGPATEPTEPTESVRIPHPASRQWPITKRGNDELPNDEEQRTGSLLQIPRCCPNGRG